ncbi:Amino acid transporter [Saccharopolyspora antimicrobica]|uniref:Amino acid transporter n=1 Tax=Saccharopolyspora antimicrobica TaxID=455193 RepID=A0A1I4W1V1_9PSEU|nr:amino acid permease [Saccharopolyspora antimicrobica]RKT87108.1 amino acid/polyamine/organocation transporter (APC superfamily) [Saccharopolyspora antimicrobica]SFN07481.1 Amino acid transporter [Saccharopolyspora antimicrobica]
MTTPGERGANGLSEFGYAQEMKRELGWYTSFAVAFGFVSIATGIFTAYGSVLSSSGPMGIWTWPVVVIGQLSVALIFGALAARIPVSGYAYQWISRLANPILGWIMGWVSFTFLGVVVVAVDYTIAATILPVLFQYQGSNENAWAITALVLLLQAILVALSTRATQRVNNVAVTIQLIGMVSLTVLLFVVGGLTGQLDFSTLFSTGDVPSEGYFALGGLTSAGPWALGFLLGAFTIVGFESAANLAEETKNPARVVPKAMAQAVIGLGVLGMLFLVAVTALAGDPVALAQSDTPVADVIARVLGSFVGKALLVLVVLSIFSCGLVISLSGARLVWAMSRDKRFPAWQLLSSINGSTGTPMNASVFMFVVSQIVLALFARSTQALFSLFSAATLLPALIYAATVVLYIVKRKDLPPSKGFELGRMEIPVLALAVVWLAYELLIFRDASFAEPWLYVLVMFGIGAVYLVYLVVRHGAKSLSMPDMHDIDKALDADPNPAPSNSGGNR